MHVAAHIEHGLKDGVADADEAEVLFKRGTVVVFVVLYADHEACVMQHTTPNQSLFVFVSGWGHEHMVDTRTHTHTDRPRERHRERHTETHTHTHTHSERERERERARARAREECANACPCT